MVGQVTSYNVPSNAVDLSSAFNLIDFTDTPFLNAITVGPNAKNTLISWFDDVRPPISTTTSAAYTKLSDAGVIAFTSVEGVRVNSIIKVAGQIKRITAISTLNVTTTHVGGSADADIASGAVIEFIGMAQVEGKDYEDSDYTAKVARYNVSQIFSDYIKFSGSEAAVISAVGVDELQSEIAKKMNRLKYQLGKAVVANPYVKPSDNTAPRIMGGVRYYIATNGYAPSAASFSAANFDAFLLEMDARGANINQVWMNPATLANFTGLDASVLIKNYDDKTIGRSVTKYVSQHGYEVALLTDRAFALKEIVLPDMSLIKMRNFRSPFAEPLAKTGDSEKWQVLLEPSLEVQNSSAMGIFTIS